MSLHTRLTRSATVLLAATVVLALFALPATSLGIGSSLGTRANPAEEAAPSRLMFVENAGQWPTGARFQVWGGPGTMWLAEDAIWITVLDTPLPTPDSSGDALRSPRSFDEMGEESGKMGDGHGVNLKLSFVSANPQPALEPSAPVETSVSYFLGNDPAQWRPEVPVYGGVRYDELYPGIDLVLGGDQSGVLPWSWEARPGAESSAVHIRVEGADSATLDGRLLRIATAAGELALPLPAAGFSFQVEAVASDGSLLNFDASPGAVDSRQTNGPSHKAPADNPADLLYSTFLGGNSYDSLSSLAVDKAGSAYVTGWTRSPNFPSTPGAFDPTYNGLRAYDTVVVKLNPAGSALIYATFLGDSVGDTDWDYGNAIAVDAAGNAYVTGPTTFGSFPTTPGAFDTSYNGGGDTFVVKLNPAGSGLVYGTYLGGTSYDEGQAITVDGAGSAYVTGSTTANDFPITPGSFDTSYNGGGDAFVAKLNPAGSGLTYATFLGGSVDDGVSGITVDSTDSAYLAGTTSSNNFPTTSDAYDLSFNGGRFDGFVVKLNPAGSRLTYATFLGGTNDDFCQDIAVDGGGRAYVSGWTMSTTFPTTPGAYDPSHNGYADVFVVKLNPAGSVLVYATFLGGNNNDWGNIRIAADRTGSAYVTGATHSDNFPTTPNAFDSSRNRMDAFVTKLNPAGSALSYSTFLGSTSMDGGGSDIAADGEGGAYVTGDAGGSDFPVTTGAFDTSHNGGITEGFVAKLAMGIPHPPTPTPTPTPTSTPTPTATPIGPWASWVQEDLPLLVPPAGAAAVVQYGNMATPVPLAANVAGAALFDTGAISGTATISTTLAVANGSYALSLIPAVGATTGQTLTIHVDVGPVMLTRDGWIARPVYLPLLVRR